MKRSATRYINFTKKALESLPIPDSAAALSFTTNKKRALVFGLKPMAAEHFSGSKKS